MLTCRLTTCRTSQTPAEPPGCSQYRIALPPASIYQSGTYTRILVDFSLAFNTIIPDILHQKLTQRTVPSSTYQWITRFLMDRKKQARLRSITSHTWTISTGIPQGCLLTPLLYVMIRLQLHQNVILTREVYSDVIRTEATVAHGANIADTEDSYNCLGIPQANGNHEATRKLQPPNTSRE